MDNGEKVQRFLEVVYKGRKADPGKGETQVRRWLSRLKISHKVILGFLGLIAFPFTLLLVCNFAS